MSRAGFGEPYISMSILACHKMIAGALTTELLLILCRLPEHSPLPNLDFRLRETSLQNAYVLPLTNVRWEA